MNSENEQTPEKMKLEEEKFSSWEELYKSIKKEGSLGLLALGARGLLLWRKKREEISLQEEKEIRNKDGQVS